MYSGSTAYDTYRQVQFETAPPEKLVLMLYNGAIRFIKEGKQFIAEKDFEKANYKLLRAQAIITELTASLDMSYEVSNNLSALYHFINESLVNANIKKETDLLDYASDLLVELRDTWQQAVKMSKTKVASV
jgi:flagellar protein FliS